jgi:hypothetical protein
MYFRPAILALFAALLFAAGAGCKKSASSASAVPPTVLSPDTIASVHWMGKRWLGYEASAFYFMRIWNLAQTAKLERQTIDRLTTVPERFFAGGTNLTSESSAQMLPLVYDLDQEESYLEIRATTNSQPSVVLAIRLNDAAQAGRWFTNLPAVLGPLTASSAVADPAQHGWSLKTPGATVRLARTGDWTIVSVGPQDDLLAAEITARIQRDGVPFVSSGTNLWLEANLDPARLANCFSLSARPTGGEGRGEVGNPSNLKSQISNLNHLTLTLSGDGGNVITRAQLTFSEPLPAQLEPWSIPLDLIHEPLTSFTAIRGVRPLLADWKPWNDLQIGTPPDQLFFWSLAGSPYQTYFAAPFPDANQEVSALTDYLLQKGNPWLAANGYINFDRAADSNGVTWGNLSGIRPFIKSAGGGSESWLFAGLLPDTNTDLRPPPVGMIQDILRRTNLVYYDWETTGPRLNPDRELGQTARQIARRPQMDLNSAGMDWLAMLIPRLGISATIITRTAPGRLTLYRRSTFGFTAPELHLLADWLESPAFPRHLHSTTIP